MIEFIIFVIIVIFLFNLPSSLEDDLTMKCNSCGKTFKKSNVSTWLDERDNEDDNGTYPCCPHCGSSNISIYKRK